MSKQVNLNRAVNTSSATIKPSTGERRCYFLKILCSEHWRLGEFCKDQMQESVKRKSKQLQDLLGDVEILPRKFVVDSKEIIGFFFLFLEKSQPSCTPPGYLVTSAPFPRHRACSSEARLRCKADSSATSKKLGSIICGCISLSLMRPRR